MQNPINYSIQNNQCLIVIDPAFANLKSDQLYNIEYWQALNGTESLPLGRGSVYQFQWEEQYYISRHYHRGGFIAHFNNDHYIFRGWENTRPWREWHLLNKLHTQQLPVPHAIACQVKKKGMFYQGDLITEKVPNSFTLSEYLNKNSADSKLWFHIANTIKQFHAFGIYHSDLNAHNILIDEQEKIWLIDFDKAKECKMDRNKCWSNLSRLQRSLIKLKNKNRNFFWDVSDWNYLMEGYR